MAAAAGGATAAVVSIGAGVAIWKVVASVGKYFGNLTKAFKLAGIAAESEAECLKIWNSLPTTSKTELAKKMLLKGGPELAKAVAKDVGAEVVKAAGPEIGEQLALDFTAQTVATQAAAGGIRGWLSSLPATSFGEGGIFTGGAGAGDVAIAGGAVAASGAVGAAIGYWIGTKLMGNISTITDVTEAGNQMISELNDVKDKLDPKDRVYWAKFAESFANVKRLMPNKDRIGANPTKDDLMSLLDLNDALDESAKQAGNVRGFMQEHMEKDFWGRLGSFHNIIGHANDYMAAAQKLGYTILDSFREVKKIVDVETAKHETKSTTPITLDQQYKQALDTVAKYTSLINKSNRQDKEELLAYMKNSQEYITDQQTELNNISAANRTKEVIQQYVNNLKALKLDLLPKVIK